MMRELIERFRYRFQLWWREEREDFAGALHFDAPMADWREGAAGETVARWNDPKLREVIRESRSRFIFRGVGLYLVGIIGLSGARRLVGTFVPRARFAVSVAFIVLLCLWTLFMLAGAVDLVRARKRYREKSGRII
jgi:hypothetical protein